jgi:hypothetical protein
VGGKIEAAFERVGAGRLANFEPFGKIIGRMAEAKIF